MQNKKIVLSGIQTSGKIHLGNYLGAIKQWNRKIESDNSQDFQFLFMLADLHSLTTQKDFIKIKENRINTLAFYLASINKKDNVKIFYQSSILEIPMISWFISNFISLGELSRMTQFKDKKAKNTQEDIASGLLFYPNLMAADILALQSNIIPVGEDQKQHIEFTRNVANKMNNFFGEKIFIIPEIEINSTGKRIMGLQNPDKKMSKSTSSEKDIIYLDDSNDNILKKIKSAITDSNSEIFYDKENRAGISNLIEIFSSISNIEINEIIDKYKYLGNKKFKEDLADLIIQEISPIREKFFEIKENFSIHLEEINLEGNEIKVIAHNTLEALRNYLT